MTLGVDANNFVLDSGSAAPKTSQTGQEAVVEAEVPDSYQLGAAYPNPFNPTTRIAYALPVESSVRLEVFNVLGQRVKGLVDGVQSAGFKTAMWDGRNEAGQAVPSGTYLYRIVADDFVDSKQVVLLK
jgi:hypothetical protein